MLLEWEPILFESYVGSIIGTMVLGAFIITPDFAGLGAVYLPLVLAAVGIIMSIIGTFFVRVKEGGNPQTALNVGEFGSAGLMVIASYFHHYNNDSRCCRRIALWSYGYFLGHNCWS